MSLPSGWDWIAVGEAGEYVNGHAFKPADWGSNGKPIIRIQNLTNPHRPLNRTRLEVPSKYEVGPGELLVSWSATLDAFIWHGEPALLNQHIFRVIPNSELVEGRLLYYWLKQAIADLSDSAHLHGSTMAHINRGPFLAHPLPLPPKSEQSRIAERLDELLSDLEAAVMELEAAKLKLSLYRQSLLKSAVEGTLTAEWRRQNPPSETGAELLARIRTDRRARWEAEQLRRFKSQGKATPAGWREKYVEFPHGEWPGPALPASWASSSMGTCFKVAVGATPSRKVERYWGGAVPWVSSGEVRFSPITCTRESITEAGLAESSTQINPVGSVLLGMIGEGRTRGQVAILAVAAANNQNCAAIWVPETDMPSEFVYYWLWSRYDETRRGNSGNNQPALNKSLVEAIPLPVPPVGEGREIVRRLSQQLDAIEQTERDIKRQLELATAQRQNILRAAFSGQLVPQDPNDEPASVLLERIRTTRQAAGSPASARRGRKAKIAA